MKRCYLDSNFLIYLKDEDSPLCKEASTKLTHLVRKKVEIYVSPLVLDETVHIIKNRLLVKREIKLYDILKKTLTDILQLPLLNLVNPPIDHSSQVKVLDLMEKYNLCPRDAYHFLTILTNHIDSLATFDNDFKKVFKEKLLIKV